MSFASITTIKEYIAWLKDKRGFLVRHGEHIALGSLIVLVSLINILWISQDTRPQPGVDPNWYLIKTFGFVDRLKERGGAQLWQSVAGLSLGGRPPLYQLLSVPFIYLFGRSADAALSVNVIFGAILLLSTYGIGSLARNSKVGLLAAFLVAAYPPIVGLSKIYAQWFALPACVALSLWLLLLLLKTRSVKIAWLFGASLGFGVLIRHFFVFHLPVPTIVFGLYLLLFQTNPQRPSSLRQTPRWLLAKLRDPFVLYGLLPAALIAAGLTAAWYATGAAAPLFRLQQSIAAGELGIEIRGFPGVPYSFWWYELTAPGAISYVFIALFAIGLVFGIVKRRLFTSVLVVTFLSSYTVLSLQKGLGWKRFDAVLPVVAVLTAIWIVGIRDWVFSTRAGPSRIVCVTEVNRHKGLITVTKVDSQTLTRLFRNFRGQGIGRTRFGPNLLGGRRNKPEQVRESDATSAKIPSDPLTLRLPADTALWDAIERGTPLQITPRIDAAGKTSAGSRSMGSGHRVKPTRYRVRLAPGTRIGRLLSTTLTIICVVVAAFNFSVVTWGVGPWSRPIAIALGAPLNSSTCLGPQSRTNVAFCPNPARDEDWRASDILRVILDDPECQARRCHLVVVPRLDRFQGSVFAYYLMRDFPQSRKRLSVSRADWLRGRTPYNPRWLTSDYLVYVPQLVTTKAKILLTLTPFLESPPPVFADAHQEIASFALPGGWTAKLIKRTAPLTLEEARLSIAALDIPEEGKSMMLRDVREQFENEGN